MRFYELANETIKLIAAVMKTNSQKSFALNLLSSPFINSPFSLKICSVYERIFFSEYSMQKLCNKLKMLKFRKKMSRKFWQTSRRQIPIGDKTLVMGILNVTPDSFSDGGKFYSLDQALNQAETMITEGADILDIGGESTRPNSAQITTAEEIERVAPVIKEIARRFDIPISIDTTKAAVVEAALDAGAEIINDISGLHFDEEIADVAAKTNAGLILMHLRGTFETMHKQEPVADILREVKNGLRRSVEKAELKGVKREQIALDVGIGFSKTFEQNLELLGKLEEIRADFSDFPMLVGTSRKSFIGKILNAAPADQRLHGTMSSVAIAVFNGAQIVRIHDVRAAVDTARVAEAIRKARK
jgi:dihydropteroate synthase